MKMRIFFMENFGKSWRELDFFGKGGVGSSCVVALDFKLVILRYMRHDTEDKAAWVQGSKADEDRFREICSLYHGLELVEGRMYDPDFLLVDSGGFAELKHRETPFHQAGRLFGIPPRYAFTYNVRDHLRYRRDFPSVHIFVRCVWLKQDPRFKREEFLDACGHGSFLYWDKLVRDAPIHHYGRREDDPVNKRRSYVLDIRNFPLFWWTDGRVY